LRACEVILLCYKPGYHKKGSRDGQKEKDSSPLMVKGRRAHIEDDGEGQSWRKQNIQSIEANKGRNDG
jgi:hypothetical protein